MLQPGASNNNPVLNLYIIYFAQIASRIAFYVVAVYFIPTAEQTQTSELSMEYQWLIWALGIVVFLISEWLHFQARKKVGEGTDLKLITPVYIGTWATSELLGIGALVLTIAIGIQPLIHSLAISSILLGLWQLPRVKLKF